MKEKYDQDFEEDYKNELVMAKLRKFREKDESRYTMGFFRSLAEEIPSDEMVGSANLIEDLLLALKVGF